MDYTSLPTDVESTVTLSTVASGTLHAVAIWVDYQLDESSRWSTFGVKTGVGKGGAVALGGKCRENGGAGAGHEKQMLRFLSRSVEVDAGEDKATPVVTITGRFDVEGGCMAFDVKVD